MTSPPRLHAGDSIALVATARKVSRPEVKPAMDTLARWGFNVVEGDHLYDVDRQFAGTDELRAAALQQALDDPSIRAVLFARGGYGTVRIIDRIDFSKFMANPKWLIGFSDVTVVHAHVQRHGGVETLHAPMAINFATADSSALDTLQKLLYGERPAIRTRADALNRKGTSQGILTGGNLSMIYSMAATPSDLETDRKILFLEDLDEHLYHVDRMMMALKRSGKLQRLAGLVVGDVSEMRDHTRAWGFSSNIPFGKTAAQIIHEHVREYDYPVCFDFPAGHRKENMPLIMGAGVTLEVADEVTLSYLPVKNA